MAAADAAWELCRAKAGGRQSTKDGTGKSIKSAGSALRRANEASLAKDIRATLESWKLEVTAPCPTDVKKRMSCGQGVC